MGGLKPQMFHANAGRDRARLYLTTRVMLSWIWVCVFKGGHYGPVFLKLGQKRMCLSLVHKISLDPLFQSIPELDPSEHFI